MAESSFYKWARGLGRITGKIVEEAKESGLGEPMARAAKKAGATVREMVAEAKAGARETSDEAEAEESAETPEEPEAKRDEEVSDDEPAAEEEPPAESKPGS
jgi:hypothetical protein